MTDKSIDQCLNFYSEDIPTTAAGVSLIGRPGTVWTIVIVGDTSDLTVINFSDDSTTYSNAHRIGKVTIQGPDTKWEGFGKGLFLTRGLCAVANNGSVDIWGVYE
jgi:hypothetical protein